MEKEFSYLLKLTKARAHAVEENALMISTSSFITTTEAGENITSGFPIDSFIHDTFVSILAPSIPVPDTLVHFGAMSGLEIVCNYGSPDSNDYGSVDIAETLLYPEGLFTAGETPAGGYNPHGMRIKIFSDTSWAGYQGTGNYSSRGVVWGAISSVSVVQETLMKWSNDLRISSHVVAGAVTLEGKKRVTYSLLFQK